MKQLRESLSYSTVALVFPLWALLSSFADSPRSPLTEYHQRVWTVEHGLTDNSIRSILQTRDGYLWIGTYSGLARFDGLKFIVFNHENSPLPEHDVRMVLAEDSDGSLWIGTEKGLFRYQDGRFTHFTTRDGLWDDQIFVLHAGKSGMLWIGTGGGLNRIHDGRLERLSTFDWTTLAVKNIYDIYEDEAGFLWILALWAAEKREIKSWKSKAVLFPNDHFALYSILRDAAGTIWIGGDAVLLQSEDSGWIQHPQPNDNTLGSIVSMTTDREGTLWFTTGITGLGRLADGKFSYFNSRDGLPDDWITRVREDREGNIWLGTYRGGLVCWQAHQFATFAPAGGLVHENVRAICQGHDGSLWIGTDGGVSNLRYVSSPTAGTTNHSLSLLSRGDQISQRFQNYSQKDGLSTNIVRSLFEDSSGRLWIGTEIGLDLFQNGVFTPIDVPGKRFDRAIRVIYEDRQGLIWIGSVHGLHCYYDGRLITFTEADGLPKNNVRVILEDRNRNLWVGALSGGLCRISFKGSAIPTRRESPDSKSKIEINADREGRHVAVPNVRDRDTRSLPRELMEWQIATYSATNGLSNTNVWALHEDAEGTIWMGTEHGLNRYKDGSLRAFTRRDGLFDDVVNSILEDDSGHLWIGCERGVYRVRKGELNDVAAGRLKTVQCVHYDEADGLLSRQTTGRKSQPTACKTPDGDLWFTTPKGVVTFDPKKVIERDAAPPVIIESVRANGQVIFGDVDANGKPVLAGGSDQVSGVRGQGSGASGQRSVISGQKPEGRSQASVLSALSAGLSSRSPISNRKSQIKLVAADAQVLEFDYTACDFIAAEKVRFKYLLEGFDKDWVDAGNRRTAFYTNLRPGHYRFRVAACNHNGLWNETGAAFAFYLAPQFWQTRWFMPLCWLLAIFLFGVVLVHLRRVHNLQETKSVFDERSRIARDLHDDLGAGLTRIRLLSQRFGIEPVTASDTARRISEDAADMIGKLDDVLWVTNPKFDALDSLVAHLREHAARFLADSNLRVCLDFPREVPAQRVPAGLRRDIFLVLKETLNNVLKHSGATEVHVGLRLHPAVDASLSSSAESLELSVIDNGCGFDPSRPSTLARSVGGNGLTNLRARMKSLGGDLEIESAPGQGTGVVARAPLNT